MMHNHDLQLVRKKGNTMCSPVSVCIINVNLLCTWSIRQLLNKGIQSQRKQSFICTMFTVFILSLDFIVVYWKMVVLLWPCVHDQDQI